MNLLLCLLILIVGMVRLNREYTGTMPESWLSLAALKWIGSGIGSAVAIVFKPPTDIKTLVVRWTIGTWVGGISTGAVISIAGLGPTEDVVLFVASGMSVLGYMLVEILLSEQIRDAIRAWAARRAEK